MGRHTIRLTIILGTISILGILLVQFVFLKQTVELNEKKFHEKTVTALKEVARSILEYNKTTNETTTISTNGIAIDQISNNYYIVNVNDIINPDLLEHFLIEEFNKEDLNENFEYAIYDCESNQMIYGITLSEQNDSLKKLTNYSSENGRLSPEAKIMDHHIQIRTSIDDCPLPASDKYTYYFGVYFPDHSHYSSHQIHPWYILNGVLLLIILFFSYTLFIIIRQRKLSEIQKNFINNLTHEFKTPLTSLNLASKVLQSPGIEVHPERLANYASIVANQTNRLNNQVEKMLEMAAMEKQKSALAKEPVALNSFLRTVIDEFKQSIEDQNVEILFVPGHDYQIKADPIHFANIIFNLLDNACKYCPENPRILFSIRAGHHYYIQLHIADNGIGIPARYRQKIFHRFFRVPTGNIHNVKGFGLGLNYVKKIVAKHGWKVKLMPNSPRGSIFIISIPLAKKL